MICTMQKDQAGPSYPLDDTSNLGLDATGSPRRRESCLRLQTSQESSCKGWQQFLGIAPREVIRSLHSRCECLASISWLGYKQLRSPQQLPRDAQEMFELQKKSRRNSS